MSNIVSFVSKNLTEHRRKCCFINRNTRVRNEEGTSDTYPCIVLYDMETGIPILYTGLERYIESLVISEVHTGRTLSQKGFAICKFLNFLLRNTSLNGIHECTLDTIRDFLRYCKKKELGESYNHDTWIRMREFVFAFLKNYYIANKNTIQFNYNGEELQKLIIVKEKGSGRKVVVAYNQRLNVKGPVSTHKKNRILVYGYLELLLYEAKKYDPELTLGIALQAYAGLREGEVVNLTCESINVIRKQFAMISAIEIDLTDTAPFFKSWEKKTNPGEIKKRRVQRVYDDFISSIIELYEVHIQRMESKGYDVRRTAPLFINCQGNPMTVQTYAGRVKELFYKYFLPALKMTCMKQNTWAENAPFIEVYEVEYPGAHMLRHWFTMYLITKAKLSAGEIMKWRGDTNQESMNAYIHENSDLITIYRESSYALQAQILEDIR